MTRSKEYTQAFKAASQEAVEFLHDEAGRMNDPHATAVLDCAAHAMGLQRSSRAKRLQSDA
ncbi:MAG: translation initiation factor IF-1, partial [Roseovarius gahaiensis]